MQNKAKDLATLRWTIRLQDRNTRKVFIVVQSSFLKLNNNFV